MSEGPEYRSANPFQRTLFKRGEMPPAEPLQRMHDALAFAVGRGCQITFLPSGGMAIDVPSRAEWCGFVKYGVDRYYDPVRIPVTGDRRGFPIIDQTGGARPRCLVFSETAPHVTWRPKTADEVPQPIGEEWYDEANLVGELHVPAFGRG